MDVVLVLMQQATQQEVCIHAPGHDNCLTTQHDCDAIVRLAIGTLLWRLVNNMETAVAADQAVAVSAAPELPVPMSSSSVSSSSSVPRLFLYSGHDTTLMPLLRALGQPVTEWPAFASHVTVELWEVRGSYYVQVLYDDKVINWPCSSGDALPPCTRYIPLKELKEHVLHKYMLSDEQKHRTCWESQEEGQTELTQT